MQTLVVFARLKGKRLEIIYQAEKSAPGAKGFKVCGSAK